MQNLPQEYKSSGLGGEGYMPLCWSGGVAGVTPPLHLTIAKYFVKSFPIYFYIVVKLET